MTSFTRLFSSLKSVYDHINPSTLTGAIDVIVVRQEDETLRCTPFHVRFGKLGVLQNQNNKVYITINGTPVEDLYMQLGEAGEAAFIGETTETSNLSPTRHLEPSNNNTSFDPDHALPHLFDGSSHPQLSNIDCSPQIVNKQLDLEKAKENKESVLLYAHEQEPISSVNVDVLQSTVHPINQPPRHRVQRQAISRTGESTDEDVDNDQTMPTPPPSNSKRRSRARKRDSTKPPLETKSFYHSDDEQVLSSIRSSRKRSSSEPEVQFFPIDDDEISLSSNLFVDAHSRLNSIDSRQKPLLPLSSTSMNKIPLLDADDDSYSSSQEDSLHDQQVPLKTVRTLSNPIPIEPANKPEPMSPLEESQSSFNALMSQSAPISSKIDLSDPLPENDSTSSSYVNEEFSPSSLPNSSLLRPMSPKSDTEYELDKSSQQAAISTRRGLRWRWKWGELPRRRNIFRYLWPSSTDTTNETTGKDSAPTEGIYLDDITNNKCDDRERYLPQMDYYLNQPRVSKDEDQESGTGNSIPQSPVREQEGFLLGDVQLSLCGNRQKVSEITEELFNSHLISYDTFVSNPSIINDTNLIVRIGGQYYDWKVASALIASTSAFRKGLPDEVIEKLQEKPTTPTKSRSSNSVSWNPFFPRKNDPVEDYSQSAAAEALALVVKSEIAPTIPQDHHLLRKNSNDSEQEDSEVRKITEKMVKEEKLPVKPVPTKTLKKTLILTSEQLERLNLKLGRNQIEFSVTTALQGTTLVEANVFLFDHRTKFVISDIDGTITKSDVFGHLFPLVGRDWSHDGIAQFFKAIQENGYQFIYLSARAIGQSRITRNFLRSIKQYGFVLPEGPLLISPDTLITALYREVIAKKPEEFKIECLKNIASLFPGKNPFYAGFGNRTNDQSAYTAVGIPETRIFTINPRGEVFRQKVSQVLLTTYKNLHEVVDQVFPPMDSFSSSEVYSSFKFWRDEPLIDGSLEDEMRQHLQDIAKRQKSKGKGSSSSAGAALPKATPTTTVIKPSGDKLITIAQATENTVKKS